MSVNKGLNMFTKLDKGLKRYFDIVEDCVGPIREVFPAKDAMWGYEQGKTVEEGMELVSAEPVKAKLFVGLSDGFSFYLDVHNRDGKPYIAELSDWGSDRNSYEALFTPFFEVGKQYGNTVCYMSSENEYDAQFRYKGFDKDGKKIGPSVKNQYGEEIGDKPSIDAFAKKELGLSVVRNIVRVPDMYLTISESRFGETMKQYVEKMPTKDKYTLSTSYAVATYDKDKNEYKKIAEVSHPLDISVSKDFEKNLSLLVATEEFQDKMKESARNLDDYNQNWDKNSFEKNDKLKKTGYGIQEELQIMCNAVFFKDMEIQKKQEKMVRKGLTPSQEKLALAIESWAKKNKIINAKGYALSLNRKSENQQASLRALVKQAKEKGFVVRENNNDKSK